MKMNNQACTVDIIHLLKIIIRVLLARYVLPKPPGTYKAALISDCSAISPIRIKYIAVSRPIVEGTHKFSQTLRGAEGK